MLIGHFPGLFVSFFVYLLKENKSTKQDWWVFSFFVSKLKMYFVMKDGVNEKFSNHHL